MSTPVPAEIKLYHIVHVDRLASILREGCLWSDAKVNAKQLKGSTIGMHEIKDRRLDNYLYSHHDLTVGDCVPFYFCPRSVMLYILHKANHPSLSYRGGQQPIIHLEVDMFNLIRWTEYHDKRWAFTTTNAGSKHFRDYHVERKLDRIDWNAVHANDWVACQEAKQAEFLLEESLPWELIGRIGVFSTIQAEQVCAIISNAAHRPHVEIIRDWYY